MFTVDGKQIDLPCEITRSAEMTASDVSGLLLNKNYMNDVIGTFMQYTVKVVVPKGKEGEYTVLYEALTDPIDAHTWEFPYNQDTLQITGRVNVVSDKYYKEENGVKIWRGTSFTVTANHPTKTYELGDMISRGLTPAPLVQVSSVGDTYLYNANQVWEMVAHDPDTGDALMFNGTTWEELIIVNLDEVQF